MTHEYEMIMYQTSNGKEPFRQWLKSLRSEKTQSVILLRIQRVRKGLFGDTKSISGGKGLRELRIDYGPGYRVYYAKVRGKFILLIGGGDKKNQKKDIQRAKEYLREYEEDQ